MSWVGPYAVIIPNGVKQNSSDVFAILDPDSGGAATFNIPFSANGIDPPTHWGTFTLLEQATYDALKLSTTQFKAYLDALAQQRGRNQLASAVAFKNNVVIRNTVTVDDGQGGTVEAPANLEQVAASLGLKRIYPPA